MLYAILCYDSQEVVGSWTKEQDEAAMARIAAVEARLAAEQRLGPVVRLAPTTSATTVKKDRKPLVLDGPFAETKEQLLGFFVVECATLEAAIETAQRLGDTKDTAGTYEIRPISIFHAGQPHLDVT
jgi:hypothetical protein